jgi:hypothetical protein
MKQLYGIAQDWPVGYDELDPYYDEAETIMSISGPDDTPFPRKGAYPQPPHLFTSVDKLLHEKYGKLYINQPTARARTPVGSRNMCCASSTCSLCPVNAKFTIENSGMGVYEDPRVELRYGAQVHHLTLAQNRAQQVHFVQDGKEQQATADAFALGANAIFNAHILLNSGDANPHTGKGIGEQIGTQVTCTSTSWPAWAAVRTCRPTATCSTTATTARTTRLPDRVEQCALRADGTGQVARHGHLPDGVRGVARSPQLRGPLRRPDEARSALQGPSSTCGRALPT